MHLPSRRIKQIGVVCLTIKISSSIAQLQIPAEKIADQIEYRLENGGEIVEYNELETGLMEKTTTEKINLNTATKEQLHQLNLLNSRQVNAIIKHINTYGALLQFEELQVIRDLDAETIRQLKTCTALSGISNQNSTQARHATHDMMIRYRRTVEKRKGYTKNDEQKYLGSPYQLFLRYRGINRQFRYGLNAEKDAGEPFFKGKNSTGFDFHSAFLSWQSVSKKYKLVLGDYRIQLGQGLLFGLGMGVKKSADVLSVLATSPSLVGATSSNESNFLRGIAMVKTLTSRCNLLFFTSLHRIDARLSSDTNHDLQIVSLPATGLHRTKKEMEVKHQGIQQVFGASAHYVLKKFQVSTVAVFLNQYPKNKQHLPDLYSQKALRPNRQGIELRYDHHNSLLFATLRRGRNGELSYLLGMLFSTDKKLAFGIVHRFYSVKNDTRFTTSFSEQALNKNESGTYLSAVYSPTHQLTLSSCIDFYAFPSSTYQVDGPSKGIEQFLQAQYRLRKKWTFTLRYKTEVKSKNYLTPEEKSNRTTPVETKNYRIELIILSIPCIQLKSRLAFKTSQHVPVAKQRGVLFFQDIQYHKAGHKNTYFFRHALFSSSDYSTRIYAYENDVLYSFSVPAYYGTGSKYYLMIRHKMNRLLSAWLRYERTYYSQQTSIGSGNEQIDGNHKSAISLQLRLSF
jgi:hypothetical protein